MTDHPEYPDLADQLEAIDQRVRQGHSIEDVEEGDLRRAARALQMIRRVKSQLTQDTVTGMETTTSPGCDASLSGIPRKLGRFEIGEPLGQGGFGMVFRGFDPNLKRAVAIKIPRPETLATPLLKERFLREGRAAAALTHPGIVPVYEAGSIGPVYYLASQLVQGQTLAEYLIDHPLSVQAATSTMVRLAEAVEHAHQRGVLHRDIKPGNILVNEDPSLPLAYRVQLTDFGLARNLSDDSRQTRAGDLLGTPAYMSPEQIENSETAGSASDVYSLGAVLFEMLTGRPPFLADTVIATLDQVRSSDPDRPSSLRSGIPRDLDAICLKCLEKQPARRYQSCHELADDLTRYLRNQPVQARPVGPVAKAWRWHQRNRAVSIGAGTTIAALAVGLIVSLALYQQTETLRERTLNLYSQSQENLKEANRQREFSDSAVQRSHETIDRMYSEIAVALRDVPGSQSLQEQMLLDALDLQREILNERPDLWNSGLKVMESYHKLHRHYEGAGQYEASLATVDEALQVYETMPLRFQTMSENLRARVRLVAGLCRTLTYQGYLDDAYQRLQAELDFLDQHSDRSDHYLKLSAWSCLNGQAAARGRQMKHAEAIDLYTLALAVLDDVDLPHEEYEVTRYRGASLKSLGVHQRATGQWNNAESSFRSSIELLTELQQQKPGSGELQRDIASARKGLADLLTARERLAEAVVAYQQVIEDGERLVAQFPERIEYHRNLIGARVGLSYALSRIARQSNDAGDWNRTIEERQQTVRMGEAFLESFDFDRSTALQLAYEYLQLVENLYARERFPEMAECNSGAQQLVRDLLLRFPDSADYRDKYCVLLTYDGLLANQNEDFERAASKFRLAGEQGVQALQLQPDSSTILSHTNFALGSLMMACFRTGDLAECLDTASQIAILQPTSATQNLLAAEEIGFIIQFIDDEAEASDRRSAARNELLKAGQQYFDSAASIDNKLLNRQADPPLSLYQRNED